MYLAKVGEVGFEDVLHVSRIGSVDLAAKRGEQPVGLVLASKACGKVMEPTKVKEVMEDGSSNWGISFLLPGGLSK